MRDLLENSGIFAYPLMLCSVAAIFIIVERLIALRTSKVIPSRISRAIIEDEALPEARGNSVADRILRFVRERQPDPEQLKAYARLQIIHMEGGLFVLDIVVAAAPLLGLLGTVTGLVRVFSKITPDSGLPEPEAFVAGIALALATTVLGLVIAIPAIVFNSYLNRRIDTLAARLNVLVERLIGTETAEQEQESPLRKIR